MSNRIALITDTHIGHPDGDGRDRLSELATKLSTYTDTCLHLGDIIHEVDKETDLDNLQFVYDTLSEQFETVYAIPGNHDHPHISREQFTAIFDNTLPEIIIVGGRDFVLLDTAFESTVQNTGYVSDESVSLLEEYTQTADEYIVASHFPINYSTVYRESEFFKQYPEGVFPTNKWFYEQACVENPPRMSICGHLHLDEIQHTDHEELGEMVILPPFSNLIPDEPSMVIGSGMIMDTQSLEFSIVTV